MWREQHICIYRQTVYKAESSTVTKLSQKAANAYLQLKAFDHVTAVTANHSSHIIVMPASGSWHFDASLRAWGRQWEGVSKHFSSEHYDLYLFF